MFKSKKNGKITKYKRYSFFNIGTLLFSIVFIYLIICIFMYLTESHITAYEVTRGSITGNYRFHAFSLRDETVVNATQSGTVRYYMREGAKASAGSVVCSVDKSGTTVKRQSTSRICFPALRSISAVMRFSVLTISSPISRRHWQKCCRDWTRRRLMCGTSVRHRRRALSCIIRTDMSL